MKGIYADLSKNKKKKRGAINKQMCARRGNGQATITYYEVKRRKGNHVLRLQLNEKLGLKNVKRPEANKGVHSGSFVGRNEEKQRYNKVKSVNL